MKVKMLIFTHPTMSGSSVTLEFEGNLQVQGNINPHDIAGTLWACEFAINNEASTHFGRPIRAHVHLEHEPLDILQANQDVLNPEDLKD